MTTKNTTESATKSNTPTTDDSDIKVGDVVCLQSGGPLMTVLNLVEGTENAICGWFKAKGASEVESLMFPRGALRHASDHDIALSRQLVRERATAKIATLGLVTLGIKTIIPQILNDLQPYIVQWFASTLFATKPPTDETSSAR